MASRGAACPCPARRRDTGSRRREFVSSSSRRRRLYRETHATFEAYCGERWGWARSHVYRTMDAAAVAGALSPVGDIPESEREARAMLDNLDPDEREQVRGGAAPPQVVLLTGLRPEAYAPQVSAKMAATPPVLEWRTLLRPPWIREDNMFGRGMTISDLISGIIISTVLGLVITVITVLGKLVKRHLGYRRYKQAGNKISYRDYKKLGDDERASGQSW